MRTLTRLTAATALVMAAASPALADGRPLNILPPAAMVGAVAGTVVGVGLHNHWWGLKGGMGTGLTTGGLLGAAAGGIIGAAGVAVVYDWGCKTFGTDPFATCPRHSWRQ